MESINIQPKNKFEFIQYITNDGFAKSNESRKKENLPPLSEKEYVDSFIQKSTDRVKLLEEAIVKTEEDIKNTKNDFDSKPKDIEELRQVIQEKIKFGEEIDKINEGSELLKKFETAYGTDGLLDRLSQLKEWLEEYKKSKKGLEDILEILNQTSLSV
jgi:hypothetical protein